MGWMAHRKWKESKLQPSMLPGPAVPGSCLASFHFRWAIHPIRPVLFALWDYPIHVRRRKPNGMEFIESIEETTDRINPIEAIAELSRSVVQSIILFAPAAADHLDAAIYLVEQIYPREVA